VSSQAHHCSGQTLVERARGEGRHAGDFHTSIERLVVDLEALIVGSVARPCGRCRSLTTKPGRFLVAAHAALWPECTPRSFSAARRPPLSPTA